MSSKKPLTLRLRIKSAERELYSGKAVSISSTNSSGKFDILPNHQNFISLVFKSISFKEAGGKSHTLEIEHGLLKCNDNSVEIFVGLDKI